MPEKEQIPDIRDIIAPPEIIDPKHKLSLNNWYSCRFNRDSNFFPFSLGSI